jgi:hypothetical protein
MSPRPSGITEYDPVKAAGVEIILSFDSAVTCPATFPFPSVVNVPA